MFKGVAQIEGSYERVVADCVHCGCRNVYSRVSDLGRTGVMDSIQLHCQNPDCDRSFSAMGDTINPPYQMLWLDCWGLKRDKHYMYCVLNLAQAYEMLFSAYLMSEFVYRPFSADRRPDQANEVISSLFRAIRGHTFRRLCGLFLNRVLGGEEYQSLDEAGKAVAELDGQTDLPADRAFESIADDRLRGLLLVVKRSKLGEVRNQVVHKGGYRPKLAEVDAFLDEAEDVLFVLPQVLGVLDSIDVGVMPGA